MTVIGLGSDIIEIARIRRAFTRYKSKFLERHLTDKEQSYCLHHKDPVPHLAGRFAAKEAVAKALGTGISAALFWHDIEIVNDKLGKPHVYLSNKAAQTWSHVEIMISISHCKDYAMATAILLEKERR